MLKGTVHPIIIALLSFTHSHVISNLRDVFSSQHAQHFCSKKESHTGLERHGELIIFWLLYSCSDVSVFVTRCFPVIFKELQWLAFIFLLLNPQDFSSHIHLKDCVIRYCFSCLFLCSYMSRHVWHPGGPASSGPQFSSSWWPLPFMWATRVCLTTSTTGATWSWVSCKGRWSQSSRWVGYISWNLMFGSHFTTKN